MSQRWIDERICCLRSCGGKIQSDQNAVVIAVDYAVLKKIAARQRAAMRIDWTPTDSKKKQDRRPVLHTACWTTICSSILAPLPRTRQSNKVKDSNTVQEIKLVKAAQNVGEEYYDSLPAVQKAAEKAAQIILNKQNCRVIAFSGAGISTASGVPDFRGTAGSRNGLEGSASDAGLEDEVVPDDDWSYESLRPTASHNILSRWVREGRCDYIITQNCDGLHFSSGVPRSHLSELHGSVFVEYCELCQAEYQRDFCVENDDDEDAKIPRKLRCKTCGLNHFTGRICEQPNCRLKDSIVNFGDDLHDAICGGLPRAMQHARDSDVCIALGSSLSVTPASQLPGLTSHLILCNLQATEADNIAKTNGVRVFATCDMFMQALDQCLLKK